MFILDLVMYIPLDYIIFLFTTATVLSFSDGLIVLSLRKHYVTYEVHIFWGALFLTWVRLSLLMNVKREIKYFYFSKYEKCSWPLNSTAVVGTLIDYLHSGKSAHNFTWSSAFVNSQLRSWPLKNMGLNCVSELNCVGQLKKIHLWVKPGSSNLCCSRVDL